MTDKRRSRSARSFWLQNPLSGRRSSFEQLEDRLNIGSMLMMLPGGGMAQYVAQKTAEEAFRMNQDRLALAEPAARPAQRTESVVSGIEFDSSRFFAGGERNTQASSRAHRVVDPSHADWFGLPNADDDSRGDGRKLIDREEQDRLLAEAEAADQPIFGGEILTLPPAMFFQPNGHPVSHHPDWSEYSTPPRMRSPFADRPSFSTADDLPPMMPSADSASGELNTVSAAPRTAANESAPPVGGGTSSPTPESPGTQTPTPAGPQTLASFPLTGFSPAMDGWDSAEFGGTTDPGTVTVEADNSALMHEGDSFVITLTHTFEIPNVPSEIAFEFTDLSFDTSDSDFINDAFEVALVDSDGYSLVGTTSPNRDVFFNITEGLSAELGDQATLETAANGQKVTLDISSVPAGSEAMLVFRLVNNDSDVNTSVRILSVGTPGLQSPPVVAEFEPLAASEGDMVTLSTTFTDNDVEDVHSAFIDWGDGTTSLGTIVESDGSGTITAEHIYADNGTYQILLEVFDDEENSATVTGEAIIENVAPSLTASLDSDTVSATATITGSFTDPGFDRPSAGTAESFVLTIDWGDGTIQEISPMVIQGSAGVETLGTFTAAHSFVSPGVYDIAVTVSDDDGGFDAAAFQRPVGGDFEIVPFDPLSAFEGDAVTLSATFLHDGFGSSHSAFIDWGDGIIGQGTVVESDGSGTITAEHIYADNGTYQILLEVFGNDESIAAVTGEARITNLAPSLTANLDFDAVILSPDTRPQLTAVITGQFTDPGFDRPSAGTVESFVLTIDWGDGTVEAIPNTVIQGAEGVETLGTFSATHPFGTPGVYDIVVTVSDDDEGTDSVSFRQAVVNVDIRPAIREPQYDPIHTWTHDTSLPHGLIPVIFEGNNAFDVTQIDARTVIFQPGGAPEYNWQMLNYEVTGDGQVDAIGHFSTWQVELDTSDVVGFVSAELWDGTPMVGVDFLPFTPFSSQVPKPPQSSEAAGTKFFVLDGMADATFRYAFDGSPLGGFETTNAVENPVGITADSTGSTVWILDGTTKMVHVHAADGTWLGAWQPRQLQQPEGIATDDTNIFIIDGDANGVLRYNGAAGLRSGYASPNGAFLLHAQNVSPTELTTDGTTIWVTDDAADAVFCYSVGGQYLGHIALDPANADASGITHDPAGTDTLWTTDCVDGVIYEYPGAAALRNGTVIAAMTLPLAEGNRYPVGIADPPPADSSTPEPATVPLAADLDGDGTVGSGDLDIIRAHWGQTVAPGSSAEGDASGDGMVGAADLDLVRADWGRTGQGGATAENNTDNVDPPLGQQPTIVIVTPEAGNEYEAGDSILVTGRAIGSFLTAEGFQAHPQRIIAVLINGTAVDALDAAGNFFAQTTLLPGENTYEVTAIDAFGQRATETVTIFGTQEGDGTYEDLLFETSPSFRPDYARTSFDERTDRLYAQLGIENIGRFRADTPFYVGITNLSDPTVSVVDPLGVTSDGIPYYNLSDSVPGATLDPAEITLHADVIFHNPNRARFEYELVFVYEVNEPPAFDSVPVLVGYLTTDYTYNSHAADPDGDTVTYGLLTAPRGMNIVVETGAISWSGDFLTLGNHEVVVQADDGRGGTARQRFTIVVDEMPPNRPPVITSVPVTEAVVSVDGAPTYHYDVEATDPDFDPVAFELDQASLDRGMDIDPQTGLITWAANAFYLGPNNEVTVTATDPYGATDTQSFNVEVLADPTNHPPVIVSEPIQVASADSPYLYVVKAVDADNDTLTYSLLVSPEWMSLNSETGEITGVPPSSAQGQRMISVRASDGRGGFDTQEYALVVLAAGTGSIVGTVYEDINRNGMRDSDIIPGDNPILVFVVDVSGSMNEYFSGTSVGDLNGDGKYNRRLDATIAGLEVLYERIVDMNFQGTVDLSLVTFSDSGKNIDMDPSISGIQIVTHPGTDRDANGVPDFIQAARSLRGGGGTNYERGLNQARTTFEQLRDSPEDRALIFLSDGASSGGNAANAVAALTALGVTMQAFGVGASVPLAGLQLIDPNPFRFGNANELYDVFSGLNPGGVTFFEPGLPGWNVYCDLNGNSLFDPGEPSAMSDADGVYSFSGVPEGAYVLREVVLPGWDRTQPWAGQYQITVNAGQTVRSKDFGNARQENGENVAPSFTSVPSNEVLHLEVGQACRYPAIAVDPDNDPLTYALPVAPNGMTVHPELGIVVWRPTIDQVGQSQVVLKVSDGRGGVDIQSFFIEVTPPNTPPVITTESLPSPIQAGSPFQSAVAAQDAEGDRLTFSLPGDAPEGLTIDPITAKLTWTPTAAQIRLHEITVLVTDEPGLTTSRTYSVEVVETLPNDPPVIESTPRTRTRIDLPYIYPIQASDPNGDPLTYTLGPGAPDTMTISPVGLLEWVPAAGDLGPNEVTLIVSDGRGGEASQAFEILVVSEIENTPPRIISNPSLSTVLGKTWHYPAEAFDAEGDPVLWNLDSAPRGMSVDVLTGELFWTPDGNQRGDNAVVLRVRDAFGASTTQSFTINVRGVNRPPAILSAPVTQAFVDEAYIYAVRAQDPDGDPLTFSFHEDQRPEGMTIDPGTGLIEWPDLDKPTGIYDVRVLVKDAFGGIDIQVFSIEVTDANLNFSPVITSTPVYNATASHDYTYTATATDPENDPLTFELDADSLARGMAIDTAGRITWSPGATDEGTHLVTVGVTDTSGNQATQSYTLSVRANQAPTITSPPVTTAAAGVGYAYDVWADDIEKDSITYRLVKSPTGMTVDDLGRIRWRPDLSLVGTTVDVTVVASDPYGGTSAPQSFFVSVIEDTTAPEVELDVWSGLVDPNRPDRFIPARLGGNVVFRITAADDIALDEVVLMVDGVPHAVESKGTYYLVDLVFDSTGTRTVVARAADLAGNEGYSEEWQASVFDPADHSRPEVTIHAFIPQVYDAGTGGLVDGDRIEGDALYQSPVLTYLTDVEISIDDDNMGNWFVECASTSAVNTNNLGAADPDYNIIAQGSGIIDHERFQIDTTLLANDAYLLRIRAYDAGGNGWAEPLFFGVSGEAKLGNFAFTLTDFSVSLAGIPIQITRTYDTLTANQQGDFGYGWSMAIADPRISETTPAGTQMQPGDRVYLTGPDGRRIGFVYTPTYQGSWFGAMAYPAFTPAKGVTSTLAVKEGAYGASGILGAFDNTWNPSQYVLTTKDGTVYEYIQDDGLQRVTDRYGNAVTFTDTRIVHSGGAQIDLVRDSRGRITEIVDTAGNAITYTYDAAGNLKTFSNQIDAETGTPTFTYAYRTDPAHFLNEIYNSEGARIFKAEFDDEGRLTGATDALGNVIQQDFDPAAFTGTVTDANGNATTLWYDDFGNVTKETSAPVVNPITGEAVTYERTYAYTDSRHPDKETRVVENDGTVVEYQYDASGNTTRTTRTSADGVASVSTSYSYDASGNLTRLTAPGGATSTFAYSRGNATSVTTALGTTAYATYNSAGKQETFTDFRGNTTTYEYKNGCPCGTPKQVTHPDGTYEIREWNRQALITKVEYYEADGTLAYVTTTDYDRLGRKTRETVGAGADEVVTRYTYDGNTENVATETIVHPTDPSQNRVTHYFYDAAGNLIRQVDPDLDVNDPDAGIFFKYDANGNRVWLRDPVGNVTTWIYDALDSVIEERDPLYWDELGTDWSAMTDAEILALIKDPTPASSAPYGESHVTRYAYDAAGNLIEEIDRNGRRRTFEYDFRGNLLEEVWYDEADDITPIREMTFTYDAAGNMLTAVDPDAEYVFIYDTMNRLETMSVDYPWADTFDTFTLTYTYDAMGNVLSATDSTGVTVRSEYDARNNLASRWWEGSEVDNIRADFDYTAVGQLKHVNRWADSSRTASAGLTDYTYDMAGGITQIVYKNAADEALAQYNYEFDFGGIVTQEVLDHIVDAYDRIADYAYDARGQLLAALYDNDQADEFFSFDANGNRTMPGYVHGPGNRLLSEGTFSYAYDAEGNMVTKTRNTPIDGEVNYTEFEYDFRNRMTKVTQYSRNPSESGVIMHEESYRYDSLGRRIQVLSDGEKTISAYDGTTFLANLWSNFDGTTRTSRYFLNTLFVDHVIAVSSPRTGLLWLANDSQNTVRDCLSSTGEIVSHSIFSSYGVPVEVNWDMPIFNGRPISPITNLSYYRSRYFDPDIGRFVLNDGIGFCGEDMNLSRYQENSPPTLFDPTGRLAVGYGGYAGTLTIPIITIPAINLHFLKKRAAGRFHTN